MESYFTDLLASYELINKRKFKLTIVENDEQNAKIDTEVERLQGTVAKIPSWATTTKPTVALLTPYSIEGQDFPIYVQTQSGERPTILTAKSGQVNMEKWRWLAKLRVGSAGTEEPEKESNLALAPKAVPMDIMTPMGGLPEDAMLEQNTLYNLQQIGNKLEKLRVDGFFEQTLSPKTGMPLDWLSVPGNLLNMRVLNPGTQGLYGKLNGEVNYAISELGYERRVLDPTTRNAFTENLFKAVTLIEESVRHNTFKEGDLQELAKTLIIDRNGLWVRGKGLPDYGVGTGGIHKKKEEILSDPFVNLVLSFNKRVSHWKKEKDIPDFEKDAISYRDSVRFTSREKMGESDIVWINYLGKSFELYPMVVAAVARGDKALALATLTKISLDVGNRIDKFNEYVAKIGINEVLYSEDSVEADKLSAFLYNDLLKIEKDSNFMALEASKQVLISSLNSLFGQSATKSFASRQPDAILHVGNISEKGKKADILEVYKESNKGKALAAAKTFGLKETDLMSFTAGDLQSNSGNLMQQGIGAGEIVHALPINFKVSWSKESGTQIGKLMLKEVFGFVPTAFSDDNLNFVTEKQPSPLKAYYGAINKQLTHLDDLFNEEVIGRKDIDPIEQTLKIVSDLLAAGDFQSQLYKKDIDDSIKRVKMEEYPTLEKIKVSIQNRVARGVLLRDIKDPNKTRLARQALGMLILETGNSINNVGLEIRNLKSNKIYRFNQNTLNQEMAKGIISGDYEIEGSGGQSINIIKRVLGKPHVIFKILFTRAKDDYNKKLSSIVTTQVTEYMKELMHEVSHNVMKGVHDSVEIDNYLALTRKLLETMLTKSNL